MRSVSLAIGANSGYVRDLVDPEKTSMPSAERLRRLAEALETTTEYLLGTADNAGQPVSEVSVRDSTPEWRGPSGAGIPVLATGYCDDLAVPADDGTYQVERIQLELDQVVRFVERPLALAGIRDAYAIDLHGNSMEPAMMQGSLRIVNPRRAPAAGNFVVAQLNDGNGGHDVVTVLVKRLVRATSAYVELEQFNPPFTFRLPRQQVVALHRIVEYEELLRP